MRRPQLCQLSILFAAVTLAGCFSATATVVPRVSGRVVDITGAPIAGATVSIARADSPGEKSREVRTDRQGRFQRGEERRWFLAVAVAAHAIGPEFTATASHQGMQSTPKRFGGDLLKQQLFGVTNPSEAFDLSDLMINQRPSSP